ncbi:MAG TPA: DUF2283 domain-containing protein [Syntrophaceae bacterium]|nr:DUF2283 domain-containing protein [Syntrophaceae bacterium]
MEKKRKIIVDYDEIGDVLYISYQKPKPDDTVVEPNEYIVLRFNNKNHEVTGVTVIAFSEFCKKYRLEAQKDNPSALEKVIRPFIEGISEGMRTAGAM